MTTTNNNGHAPHGKAEDDKSITNERTGEIMPRGANTYDMVSQTGIFNFSLVGTLILDDNARKVFAEPLDPADVRIRPDGNVYVDWTWYAEKLNRAVGVLQWGLIPDGQPVSKTMGDSVLVAWGHWLIIKGVPVGFAIGECNYQPSNAMMSYGDACEGAKSNAISRNCKILGMTLQLWDREWKNAWREKYAESYKNERTGKSEWRKKRVVTQPAGNQQAAQSPAHVGTPASGRPTETNELTEAQQKQKVLEAWGRLAIRAKAMRVPVKAINANMPLNTLKATYNDLLALVKKAEAEAEAAKWPVRPSRRLRRPG